LGVLIRERRQYVPLVTKKILIATFRLRKESEGHFDMLSIAAADGVVVRRFSFARLPRGWATRVPTTPGRVARAVGHDRAFPAFPALEYRSG
jgi:hypothetical protein